MTDSTSGYLAIIETKSDGHPIASAYGESPEDALRNLGFAVERGYGSPSMRSPTGPNPFSDWCTRADGNHHRISFIENLELFVCSKCGEARKPTDLIVQDGAA